MRGTVAVIGGEPLLAAAVQRACPSLEVKALADETTALIIAGSVCRGEEAFDAVCIVVSEEPGGAPAGPDQIVIPRSVFLAAPEAFGPLFESLAGARSERKRLEAELRASREVEDLLTVGDIQEVASRVTRQTLQRLALEQGTLLLYDSRVERFVPMEDSNEPRSRDIFPGAVIARAIPDAFREERGYTILRATAASPRPLLLIPIFLGSDPVGVFAGAIGAAAVDADRLEDARRYLRSVAVVLTHAVQLSRSIELTLRDDLTKAYNRRFFESCMDEEIQRARRYNTLFSIIFLDLDDLKEVNNRYGHLAGSRTLQEVARRILGAVRAIDKVVRFGGDEFCVALPQTDPEQAKAVANRIRRALDESPIAIEPNIVVPITASFGIATYPVHAQSKEELVHQADQAMLSVKSTTKDGVGIASGDGPAPQARRAGE